MAAPRKARLIGREVIHSDFIILTLTMTMTMNEESEELGFIGGRVSNFFNKEVS